MVESMGDAVREDRAETYKVMGCRKETGLALGTYRSGRGVVRKIIEDRGLAG